MLENFRANVLKKRVLNGLRARIGPRARVYTLAYLRTCVLAYSLADVLACSPTSLPVSRVK